MKNVLRNIVLYIDDRMEKLMICGGVAWCVIMFAAMIIDWGLGYALTMLISCVVIVAVLSGLCIGVAFLYEKLLAWAVGKG